MLDIPINTASSMLAGDQDNFDLITQSASIAHLSAPQKAAIVLITMGPDYARPVAEKISDDKLRSFVSILEELGHIPRETLLAVVADFVTAMRAQKGSLKITREKARLYAEDVVNSDRFNRIINSKVKSIVTAVDADVWSRLSKEPIGALTQFLETQRVEVGCIIMSKLPTEISGEVLAEMDEEKSIDYISRLAQNIDIKPKLLRNIAELVRVELLEKNEGDNNDAATEFVAELLSVLPKKKRDIVLDGIESSNPEQAERIKNGMLIIDDLPSRLPPTAINIVFKELPKDKLLAALKAGKEQSPTAVEFLLANISQRMADQYREEIEELPELSEKAGDKAVTVMMGLISKLDRDGRIKLLKKPGSEDPA